MYRIINLVLLLAALCSCSRSTKKPDEPCVNLEQRFLAHSYKNILIITDGGDNPDIRGINNAALLALEKPTPTDTGILFMDYSREAISSIDYSKVLSIILFSNKLAKDDISALSFISRINRIPTFLVTSHTKMYPDIVTICLNNIPRNIDTALSSLIKKDTKGILLVSDQDHNINQTALRYGSSDAFVDIIKPSGIQKAANRMYDIAVFTGSNASKVDAKKKVLVNTFDISIPKIMSSEAEYFISTNFNELKRFSDKYSFRFSAYPTLRYAICFDLISAILKNISKISVDSISADLTIASNDIGLYYIDGSGKVTRINY